LFAPPEEMESLRLSSSASIAWRLMASQLPDALRDTITELPLSAAGRDVLVGRLLPRIYALARRTLELLDQSQMS
jgi:hypothetical protein